MPKLPFIAALALCAILWRTTPAAADAESDYQACASTPEEAAIPFCTRAIDSNRFSGRDLAGIYLNRGLRYDYIKDYDRAIADYTASMRAEPSFAKAYNNRGSTFFKIKDNDRAIVDYDEALRLDPKYVNAWTGRAAVYDAMGKYDRALTDLDQAIRLDSRNAIGYFNRAATYLHKKDYDRALTDYSEMMRLRPDVWQGPRNRAITYLLMGNYDRAKADFATVTRLNPKLGDSLYGGGLIKLKQGDTAGGNADIASAKAIKPDIAEQWKSDFGVSPDMMASAPPPAQTTANPAPAASRPPAVAVPAGTTGDPCALAATHWASAESIGTVAAFEDHLARFPTCTFAGLARQRIAALGRHEPAPARGGSAGGEKSCGPGLERDSDGDCVRKKTARKPAPRQAATENGPSGGGGGGGQLDCSNPMQLMACANRALGTLPGAR